MSGHFNENRLERERHILDAFLSAPLIPQNPISISSPTQITLNPSPQLLNLLMRHKNVFKTALSRVGLHIGHFQKFKLRLNITFEILKTSFKSKPVQVSLFLVCRYMYTYVYSSMFVFMNRTRLFTVYLLLWKVNYSHWLSKQFRPSSDWIHEKFTSLKS